MRIKTAFILLMIGGLIFSSGKAMAEKRSLSPARSSGTIIPQEIVMKVPPGSRNKKMPVPFHHASHKPIECTVCHHTAYDTLAMSSCSLEGCHSSTEIRDGVNSFYAAFHDTFEKSDRGCLDCHKTQGKGPTGCKACHHQPGQANQQPEQVNPQPGQVNQQSGQVNQQPGQANQQPGQANHQPGQVNQQPGQVNP